MHDIRAIRESRDAFVAGLKRRSFAAAEALTDELLACDRDLRLLQTRLQEAQARRNDASKLIGRAKAEKNEALAQVLMAEVAGLKNEIQEGEEKERLLQEELRRRLAELPNLPAGEVPDGVDEAGNVEVEARRWGSAPGLNAPKEHFDLGEALGLMDFERAAKVSGARFVFLESALARLERALGNFMLDLHTEHFGYTEVSPPLLVRDAAAFGTGQLPKFADDLFRTIHRLLADPDRRSAADQLRARGNPRRSRSAAARHGVDAVLPRRSGRGGQGYARHDPHASILQGRARVDHDAGAVRWKNTSA